MKSIDERVMDLEKEMAVVRELIEYNLSEDGDFRKDIRATLDYLKERNTKVDSFIESEIQIKKEREEFWKTLKDKLVTSGVFGLIGLIGTVLWYAAVHFVQSGGK